MNKTVSRRGGRGIASICGLALVVALGTATAYGQSRILQGPFVGHTTPDSVALWARLSESGAYSVVLTDESGSTRLAAVQDAHPDRDRCVVWKIGDLEADHEYRYRIEASGGTLLTAGDEYRFRTSRPLDEPAAFSIAFGSCAHEDPGHGGSVAAHGHGRGRRCGAPGRHAVHRHYGPRSATKALRRVRRRGCHGGVTAKHAMVRDVGRSRLRAERCGWPTGGQGGCPPGLRRIPRKPVVRRWNPRYLHELPPGTDRGLPSGHPVFCSNGTLPLRIPQALPSGPHPMGLAPAGPFGFGRSVQGAGLRYGLERRAPPQQGGQLGKLSPRA